MIIKVLSENISNSPLLKKEHGLCLYIKTENKEYLFDFGASQNFYFNANQLNLNLSDVDYAILSHGHSDHGGGLSKFMEINKVAKIFAHKEAFLPHFSFKKERPQDIGVNMDSLNQKRLIFVEDRHKINESAEIFRSIKEHFSPLSKDYHLFTKDSKNNFRADTFSHEINLLIKENEKTFLFTGCAHRGIRNILEEYKRLFNAYPTYVIGGFHLSKIDLQDDNILKGLNDLVDYMKKTKAYFYTGHCTGYIIYEFLKKKLKDQINYISTGTNIKI